MENNKKNNNIGIRAKQNFVLRLSGAVCIGSQAASVCSCVGCNKVSDIVLSSLVLCVLN